MEAKTEAVIHTARKEKPTNLFICEDLAFATLKKREPKIEAMKAAKKAGTVAYFVLDKLIIDNFQLALFELSNGGSINFDCDRLASLKFNPLLCESYKNFSLCKDLDPDSNFYSDIDNCEYFTEDSFNNMLSDKQNHPGGYGNIIDYLSLLHFNIRSIDNKLKFDRFTNFVEELDIKFSIIGISETWLNDSDHSVHISGFEVLHNHRVSRSGGGVGLYLAGSGYRLDVFG